MSEVHIDSPLQDEERRRRLYAGGVFIYTPTETTRAFCEFAAGLIQGAFAGLDPRTAQYELSVERYIEILGALKPHFIHHPESKRFVAEILRERGCDPDDIYFDVPRLRSSTSDGYLTSGIAYAWHPHRDTWYSAPPAQVNWWTPIYPMSHDNGMCFFFDHFDRVVANDSRNYDYGEWNQKYRFTASSHVKKDLRPLPGPIEPVPIDRGTAVICPVGGLIAFSGGQLHASVTNTSGRTRFSIDFRSVSLSDCRGGIGAACQDVACTGSSIRDFRRTRDFEPMPENVAAPFENAR